MDPQEQAGWDDVNKLLQHHGFKAVSFADPVENKNLSDLVLLDKRSAAEVRATLRTMLADSERRQALVQELVKSNNQLKDEVAVHLSRAAQQSRRAAELEGLLDEVKTRVRDLEDRYLGGAVRRHSHAQQLQQEKEDAQRRCEALEQKLARQREKAAQLQRKLYFAVKEEEQTRALQHTCSRVGQCSCAADKRVLDVIDFYETEMGRLLEELRSVKGEPGAPDQKRTKTTPGTLRAVLKACRAQRKESGAQVEELKKEVERLKQELETRSRKEAETSEHVSDARGGACSCGHYHHLLTEISAIVSDPGAPLRLHRQKPTPTGGPGFNGLLPTLEVWTQQLHLLKELRRGLTRLATRLTPWHPPDGSQDSAEVPKVEDMMLLVDTMLESTSADEEKVLRSPTRYTLGSMLSHFQKLFDVTSLSGIYPRMNEVYARLGEMTNAMRNLRDVLDLDSRVPPAEVVAQVAQLARSSDGRGLLGDADIDSIVVKVRQHEEFFPAFHALVTDILHTLGVTRLDDIIPALQSLKQTAQ